MHFISFLEVKSVKSAQDKEIYRYGIHSENESSVETGYEEKARQKHREEGQKIEIRMSIDYS